MTALLQLKLTKEQKDAIAWLQAMAASPKDGRPALEGIRVTSGGAMVATDGFVLGYWAASVDGAREKQDLSHHKSNEIWEQLRRNGRCSP